MMIQPLNLVSCSEIVLKNLKMVSPSNEKPDQSHPRYEYDNFPKNPFVLQ